ncbi:phosphonate ABC transporter ATP-binding protein [Aestuariispira insulae]|uniref:Phosphonate transport system ATP-binding protein n=1 Tax=Aestuariispira insulae TaxID=1461337 RepID=A0A3D9H613_9PROT|nr:phosphonate ABC transporter ATP-binding protein [Aestuariispira insulae]RED44879.1 phosphonate transport system ATP-binding protein [Aestuariispira insulae]
MGSLAEQFPLDGVPEESAGTVPVNRACSSMLAALRVKGLSKSFGGGAVPVFRDISFQIPKGQSVALIGANGSGKSTLLRCSLRLIEPDSGSIIINDENLTGLRGRQLRRKRARVGFVFQKHNLVPRLSVLSNVCHGSLSRGQGARAWLQGFCRREERAFALHCLDQVGLADLAERRADHLSGGQSQRVAIARTLMQRPEMIFADEPTASLDPQAGQEIMELFHQLSRDEDFTFMFVSHQLDHALDYADRVLGLKGGELAIDGPVDHWTASSLRGLYD